MVGKSLLVCGFGFQPTLQLPHSRGFFMRRILNLYAGIGGNRKLWNGDIHVTAIELNSHIAKIYQDFFPQDTVIVADAHQYLLEHYNEFDFIWSSPPCTSHSRARMWGWKNDNRVKKLYPDMALYQEILFLQHFFKGKYVIENVIGYYKPLIEPQKIGRHYFWSNFTITDLEHKKSNINRGTITSWEENIGLSLEGKNVGGHRKDAILRNCVEPELGLHILNQSSPSE